MFNQHPRKGLSFLQSKGLLGTSPDEVAKFFYENENLDKLKISSYLGKASPVSIETMCAYVKQMDFQGLELVPALQLLFEEGIALDADTSVEPWDSNQKGRLMQQAGERYFECNPNHKVIREEEIATDLAFYILFLNGNLHSDKNQNKSTKEQFIRLCTDREHMKHIPKEFITKIYDDILKNAFTTFGKKVVATNERKRLFIFKKKM